MRPINLARKNNGMGVKGLYSFIKSSGKPLNIKCARDLRIGVDISFFLYRWGFAQELYFSFIRTLQENGNKVLFVFDGKPGAKKEPELEERRRKMEKAEKYVLALEENMAASLFDTQQTEILQKTIEVEKRKIRRPTKLERHTLKEAFYREGIPMLKSSEEADELLVALIRENDIDVIITGDTDIIRLGASRVWMPTNDSATQFLEFNSAKLFKSLGITWTQFQEVCILCGGNSMGFDDTRKIDIRKAYNWIRVYGSIATIIKKHFEWWPCDFKDIHKRIAESIAFTKGICVEQWLREDEKDRLVAWRQDERMPYTT
uniref:XPG N-terminal domain-containing protein n=1 Tax=viral metagenome TaxID=1070528 RepID=A0A6C0IC90_9ZZZZ